MASIVYPDAGLIPLATRLLTSTVRYHLFDNNATVNRDTVLGDFAEGGFAGYAPINVVLADWVLQAVVAHHGVNQAAPINFVNTDATTPHNVFGYYVTDTGSTELLWALKFDGVRVILPAGGLLPITPFFGDYSVNPP